jgi:hypothetical protein
MAAAARSDPSASRRRCSSVARGTTLSRHRRRAEVLAEIDGEIYVPYGHQTSGIVSFEVGCDVASIAHWEFDGPAWIDTDRYRSHPY